LQAGDGKSALKKLDQTDIDVVLCDVKLPDGNGVELLQQIKAKFPLTEIILLTAYGNIPDGVQAIKNGAFDYITKGDDNNKIIPLLYRAVEKAALAKRIQQLEKQLANKFSFDSILGKSKLIKTVIDAAQKVAVTDATVLLTGETGTGKEIFAQAIHNSSLRSKQHFVAVNCSAFSKDLLENELFGHKAGAITGAVKETKGIFEEANNGCSIILFQMPSGILMIIRCCIAASLKKIIRSNSRLLIPGRALHRSISIKYSIAIFGYRERRRKEQASDFPSAKNLLKRKEDKSMLLVNLALEARLQ
jgi:DNA-binding NtrC family response regulator